MDREKDEPVSSLGNRMTLCAVAICLMWLTSLRCVVSLVGFFIPAPTESSVIEDCRTAYVRLDAEKTNHMTCADFQLDQCFKNLDSAVLQANDAIGATQRANSDLISNLSAANSVCTSVLTQSTNSLSSWSLLATQSPKNNVSVAVSGISYNIEYGSNGSTVLSEWEKNSCRALVHDVGSGSVDSLQSNSSAYALGSDGSVSRVVQYSIALNAYNQQYVQNKTSGLRSLSLEALDRVSVTSIDSALNSSLQTLKAELMMAIVCLSFNGTDGSCPLSGQRMVDVYQTYSAWISRYIDAFTIEVAQKSSAYVTAVEGALTVAQQFFDAVSGATGLIKYIKNSLPGVNLCGKSNPDWCQFSKSSLYISGIDMPSMSPGELQMPPVTYMWKKVEGMAHDILGMFSSSGVDLREQNLAFYRELHDAVTSVDFSTSDYHPPTYADFSHDGFNDPKEEASAQRNRTLEYQSSVTAIISGMNADAANIADMFRASFGTSFNATALFSSATTLPQVSSFSMPLHTSVFVRMESIAAWLAPLLSIRTLLFLFDYLYRIAQSIRLLTSYWNSSAAELPPVDLRVKGDGTLGRRLSKSDSWSQYLNNAATWFLLLASSWMYVVLFVVLVALILYVLAGVFMAEYSSYAGACVSHSTEQSHLSAFATQLAVFYASKPGHEAIVRGVAKYNVEVASVCSSQQQNASTHSLYSTQMRDFVSMNRTRHATLDNVDLLFRCVNMSDMDRQFTSHCDGESDSGSCNQCPVDPNTNHPFQTPSSYILNETRAVCYDDRVQQRLALSGTSIRELLPADAFKTVSIRPDAFNCTALPSCEITCSSPDPSYIGAVTKQCSCMAEWYLNSSVFQVLIAVVVYAFLQCSRTLFCSGLVMINFDLLSAGSSFQVLSECNRDSTVPFQERIVVSGTATTTADGDDDFATVTSLGSDDDDSSSASTVTTSQDVELGAIYPDISSGNSMFEVKQTNGGSHICWQNDTVGNHKDTEDNELHAPKTSDSVAVQRELEAVIQRYKRSGWWKLLAGVCINFLWLIVLFFARRNMAYSANG